MAPRVILFSNFLFIAFATQLIGIVAAAGSCRESRLCCPGRDSSCVVQKSAANTIVEDLNEKPCYCDGACITLGDCCHDYKQACGGKF